MENRGWQVIEFLRRSAQRQTGDTNRLSPGRRVGILILSIVLLISQAEGPCAEPLQLCQSKRKGYVKQDSLFKDRMNIYDEKGQRKGYLKKESLDKDKTIIYDESGRKKGYLEQDALFEGRNEHL